MNKAPGHFLNELPVWKLKLVAEAYRIEVSACRYKRDYIERIAARKLTEEQVREALRKAQQKPVKTPVKDTAEEMKEIGKEIRDIAERPGEPKDIPLEDEKILDRHIDEALTLKPSFFEVDSTNQDAMNKMIVGDYHDAIKANHDARIKCLDQFSNFQVYSAAVSIRASEELLSKLPKDKGEVISTLKTSLAAAKMAFVHGTPRQREETIENLESLATKAYEAYWGASDRAEAELLGLLRDYESFGTRTEEARRYVEIAASAKRMQNLEEHARMLGQAREAAEKAKAVRAVELESAYHMVRAAAEEARESGASVPAAETGLAEAKKAMVAGSFAQAARLMAEIERAVDAAHIERLKADKELEKKKASLVRAVESEYGPLIREAASYGLDVREPAFYAGNMKAALDRDDLVNAAKFARRVKEVVTGMEKDLDMKRIEAGVASLVPDAKCDNCGKESLYSFPGSVQKCTSCGHTLSVLPATSETELAQPIAQPTRKEEHLSESEIAEGPKQPQKQPERKKRWFKW